MFLFLLQKVVSKVNNSRKGDSAWLIYFIKFYFVINYLSVKDRKNGKYVRQLSYFKSNYIQNINKTCVISWNYVYFVYS